jgi:hypothetical protein
MFSKTEHGFGVSMDSRFYDFHGAFIDGIFSGVANIKEHSFWEKGVSILTGGVVEFLSLGNVHGCFICEKTSGDSAEDGGYGRVVQKILERLNHYADFFNIAQNRPLLNAFLEYCFTHNDLTQVTAAAERR